VLNERLEKEHRSLDGFLNEISELLSHPMEAAQKERLFAVWKEVSDLLLPHLQVHVGSTTLMHCS
jgi:hypothetical protein